MDVKSALKRLEALKSKDPDKVSKRRGERVGKIIGVSTADIRKLGKTLGQNDLLASQLWRTDIHEARILAILIAPLADKTEKELGNWVSDINSWGICDHFAKRLSEIFLDVSVLISSWTAAEALYTRRAGLALAANYCMKQRELEDETSQLLVTSIEHTSKDNRQHVKQACCWALRELGKIDTKSHEIAINLALELIEASNSSSVWVGKCAHKELESLVKIPERRRLISSKSKTASKYRN